MNERVTELVVDDFRIDNDEGEDEVETHVDDNVKNENQEDEDFDVENAVNLVDVDEIVVNVEVIVNDVNVGNEKIVDEVFVDQGALGRLHKTTLTSPCIIQQKHYTKHWQTKSTTSSKNATTKTGTMSISMTRR